MISRPSPTVRRRDTHIMLVTIAGALLLAPGAHAGFITVKENTLNYLWTTTVPVIEPGDTWSASFLGSYDAGTTLLQGTFIATLSGTGRSLSLTLTDLEVSCDHGYAFQFEATYWAEFDVAPAPLWIGHHSILGETSITGNGHLGWLKTSRHNLDPLPGFDGTVAGPATGGFSEGPAGVFTNPMAYYEVHSQFSFGLLTYGPAFVRLPDSALDWAIPSPASVGPLAIIALACKRRR